MERLDTIGSDDIELDAPLDLARLGEGRAVELYGRMFLIRDHGADHQVFEDVEVLADQAGYRAASAGKEVVVRLYQVPCQDTIVGWTSPVMVSLEINGQTVQACGRFLR